MLNESACITCDAGKYQTELGSIESNCSLCSPGKYYSGLAASSAEFCMNCTAGMFSSVAGSVECVSCVAGKYTVGFGVTSEDECLMCDVGKYALPNLGRSCAPYGRSACAAAQSSITIGHPAEIAVDGIWTDLSEAGLSETDTEPGPWWQIDFGVSRSVKSGQLWKRASGVDPMAAGGFQVWIGNSPEFSGQGNLNCFNSSAGGKPSAAPESFSCAGTGRYVFIVAYAGGDPTAVQIRELQLFPSGGGNASKVSGAATSNDCTSCSAGKYQTGLGRISPDECVPCSRGKFSNATAASSNGTCIFCDIGHYAGSDGMSACTRCPAGSYSETTDAINCAGCKAGYFSTVVGATANATCSLCGPGSYGPLTGRSACSL